MYCLQSSPSLSVSAVQYYMIIQEPFSWAKRRVNSSEVSEPMPSLRLLQCLSEGIKHHLLTSKSDPRWRVYNLIFTTPWECRPFPISRLLPRNIYWWWLLFCQCVTSPSLAVQSIQFDFSSFFRPRLHSTHSQTEKFGKLGSSPEWGQLSISRIWYCGCYYG